MAVYEVLDNSCHELSRAMLVWGEFTGVSWSIGEVIANPRVAPGVGKVR